jgi:hypothetical protein
VLIKSIDFYYPIYYILSALIGFWHLRIVSLNEEKGKSKPLAHEKILRIKSLV